MKPTPIHTEGPWTATEGPPRKPHEVHDAGRSGLKWIAQVNGRNPEERRANAALVAASPSLLKACQELLANAEADQQDQAACKRLYEAWQAIREAVADATGQRTLASEWKGAGK